MDKREANTQAPIQSGETVVIGGLRKSDVVQETSKVPLVGDLPVIGPLFQFKAEKTVKSELVVFITPRIVKGFELTQKENRMLQDAEARLGVTCPPKVVSVDCECE